MSGSVSPLPWTGNKGCIYTTIDAFMPPHRTYVEACMGSAEVFLRKKPVEKEIINDYNGDLVRFFRVLQRNENLERLIGRLFLSFNSEQIFRANKALLAEVPNILDDLTETSVIIHRHTYMPGVVVAFIREYINILDRRTIEVAIRDIEEELKLGGVDDPTMWIELKDELAARLAAMQPPEEK